MVDPVQLRTDFNNVITINGQALRLRYYTASFSGAIHDQEFITQSGTDAWMYGMPQAIDTSTGGTDRKFVEQGLVLFDDRKFFLPGSIEITNGRVKIMLGSPSTSLSGTYAVIDNGWIPHTISGIVVYNTIYGRILQNGSFQGEY